MFASTKLAVKYAIFALIATAANIGAQDLVVRAYNGTGAIVASIVAGTGVGLVVKYLLDKRYIFRFRAASVAHEANRPATTSLTASPTSVGAPLGSPVASIRPLMACTMMS